MNSEPEQRSTENGNQPNESDAVLENSATITESILSRIRIEELSDSEERKILHAAIALLSRPDEVSIAEIRLFAETLSEFEMRYEMNSKELPKILEDLSIRMVIFLRRRYISEARSELEQSEPDLLKLLQLHALASDNAATMPPSLQRILHWLMEDILAKKIQNDTYDAMCSLADLLTQASEYCSLPNNRMFAMTCATMLQKGSVDYAERMNAFIPKLRGELTQLEDGGSKHPQLQSYIEAIEAAIQKINV